MAKSIYSAVDSSIQQPRTTKRFKMEDGSQQLFTKIGNKWLPALEVAQKDMAKEESSGMAFLAAMNAKTEDLITGTNNLFGGERMDMEDNQPPAVRAAMRSAHPKATTLGSITGEIAQIAAPGGAALKIPKVAAAAKSSPILTAGLTDLVSAVGTAGLRNPSAYNPEREDNMGNRLTSMGAESLYSLLGLTGVKALTGVTPSRAGKEALDSGRYLTPGYATDNHILNGIESAMEVIPGTANATKVLRAEAQQDWRNNLFQTVADKLGIKFKGGETGRESFTLLDDALDARYKSAMDGVTDIPRDTFKTVYERIAERSRNLSRADQDTLKEISNKIRSFEVKAGKEGSNPAALADQLDYYLRTQAKTYDGPLGDSIRDLKKTFHQSLDPEVATELAKLDEVFPEVKTLSNAVSDANKQFQEGGFSPSQIMGASARNSDVVSHARGDSPLFDLAQAGGETVGKKEGGQPLEWFRRLAGVAPSPPGMKTAGNMILGNTAAHRAVKELPPEFLRAVNPSRVLPAASGEENEDEILQLIRSLLKNVD